MYDEYNRICDYIFVLQTFLLKKERVIMDFTESIKQFSERVSMLKDTVSTEEATKMSLVVPLFQLLGYDVFNPSEFCPEYIADVGIKKAKKSIMRSSKTDSR